MAETSCTQPTLTAAFLDGADLTAGFRDDELNIPTASRNLKLGSDRHKAGA